MRTILWMLLLVMVVMCVTVRGQDEDLQKEEGQGEDEGDDDERVANVMLDSGVAMWEWLRREFSGRLELYCAERTTVAAPKDWPPHWFRYLHALCDVHVASRAESMKGLESALRVVIVGGGPSGLLNGLQAYQRGANVTVVEKRLSYERNVWFDISDGAWGDSLSVLLRWGLRHLEDELDLGMMLGKWDFSGKVKLADVLPMRCQSLERFLAQSCILLGIDMHYGVEYVDKNDSAVLLSSEEWIPFDVIVDAEGQNEEPSALQQSLGIQVDTSMGMRQTSVFVRFKECPHVSDSASMEWEVAAHVEGVVMAYRRFFNDQCDLQILIDDKAATALEAETFDPWQLVLDVTRHALPGAFAQLEDLQRAVGESGLNVVHLPASRASESTVCGDAACSTVGVLVGDAVFPAHYRLGIGVNNAIDALHDFGVFLWKLRTTPSWADAVAEKKAIDEQRMASVWRHQLQILWLESYCGAHVFQETIRVAETAGEQESSDLDFSYRHASNPRDLFVVRVSRNHPMMEARPGAPIGRTRKQSLSLGVKLAMDVAVQKCQEVLSLPHWLGDVDAGEEAARRVLTDAIFHDPDSVISVIDRYGHSNWMMNVGDVKGEFLTAQVQKLPPGACVLELGAYIGYSGVRIGRDLKAGAHLVSLEKDPRRAKLARQTVAHAGLSDRVKILQGVLQGDGVVDQETLARHACHGGAFSLIFFDHAKEAYLPDLVFLEGKGFIQNGTVIVADNVLYPGSPDFREYIKNSKHYQTEEHETLLEYQTEKKDIVLIAVAISSP